MTVLFRLYGHYSISNVAIDAGNRIDTAIRNIAQDREFLPLEDVFVTCNGRLVQHGDLLQDNHIYHVCPKLVGGKGGFGSMLRAIGAQIEKTTSREACRDLSGRRMRDVNNEKSLKDWISKQADREKEKEERRKERRERRLAQPRHKFEDLTYEQQKIEVAEKQEEALSTGFKKIHSKKMPSATVTSEQALDQVPSRKRKAETATSSSKVKKQTEWLGVDIDNLSDMDSEDEEGACTGDLNMLSKADSLHNSENIFENLDTESAKKHKSSNGDKEDMKSGSSDLGDTDPSFPTDKASGSSGDSVITENDNSRDSEVSSSAQVPVSQNNQDREKSLITDNKVMDVCSKNQMRFDDIENNRSETDNKRLGSCNDNISDKKRESADANGDKGKHGLLVALSAVNKSAVQDNEEEEGPLNLDQYSSVEELEALGLNRLKSALMELGLKCGGTLQQRAERLMAIRGLTKDQIDPSLFAKPNSKGGKRK